MALSNIGKMAYDTRLLSNWTAAMLLNWHYLESASIVAIPAFSVNYDQKQDHRHGYSYNSSNDDRAGRRSKKCFPENGEENDADDQRCQIRKEMRPGFLHALFHYQFTA